MEMRNKTRHDRTVIHTHEKYNAICRYLLQIMCISTYNRDPGGLSTRAEALRSARGLRPGPSGINFSIILGSFWSHFGVFWLPFKGMLGLVKICTPLIRQPTF